SEPTAHADVVPRSASATPGCDVPPGRRRSATPANPTIRPITAGIASLRPNARRSNRATYSGITATIRAASPELSRVSAQATPALPIAGKRPPATAAGRPSRQLGRNPRAVGGGEIALAEGK